MPKHGFLFLLVLIVVLFIAYPAFAIGTSISVLNESRTDRGENDVSNVLDLNPEYAPSDVIVKFKPGVIDVPVEKQRVLAHEVVISASSIDILNQRFGLIEMERIFKTPLKKNYCDQVRTMTAEEQVESIEQKFPQIDLSNIYKLTFPKDANVREIVEEYKKDPNVEYAQLNYIVHAMTTPNDPNYSAQWGLPKIKADDVWDIEKGNSTVVVAVIDTGIDYNHEDLDINVWNNTGEISNNSIDDDGNGYIDDVRGWDFSNGDNDPMDDNGHGTYCSGIISAVTDNGIGIAGVSWYSKIMGVKGLDADGVGYTVNLAKCIKYAAYNGADVIYNGWGIKNCLSSQPLIEDAIRYAHNLGCVVVFPAGNYNDDVIYRSPANMAEVITVAATDQNDKKASFSDYGSLVDVSAPGVDILSLWRNDSYSQGSGTSASASYVAGVAALILSKNPSWSNDEVERCLRSTTDNIDFLNPDYAGLLGTGRINAHKAVTTSPKPKIIFYSYSINDSEGGDSNGQAGPNETIKLTVILKNIWLNATNVSASLTTTDPYINITDGDANFGNIPMDSTRNNSLNPYSFSVDESCPLKHNIMFNLSITATNYSDVDYFTIPIEIFSYHEGWPVTCGWTPYWEQISSPIISDIDEDGDNEILFGEMSHLYVFNSDGSLVFKYRLDTPENSDLTRSTPAVGDIDGDGDLEIVIAGKQRFFAFHHDGTVVDGWPIDTMVGTSYDPESSGPVLADLDGDGDLEIIAGSMNGNMYVWHGNGSNFTGWPKTLGGYVTFVVSYPAVADIDKDGDLEIITGVSNDNKVYAWHSNGTLVDGWPVSVDNLTFCSTVIGDINGDGNLEIMVSTIGGETYAFDKDGNILPGWPFPAAGNALSLGDIDADGLPELLFGASNKVYALNGDASLLSGWPIEMEDDVWASPALADMNGDGHIDIVVATLNKPFKLYAFDHNGMPLKGWPLDAGSSGGHLMHTPLIGDIDQDGNLNLVVVSPDTKVYAWDLPYPCSADKIEWGMFQHDIKHTGVYPLLDNISPTTRASAVDDTNSNYTFNTWTSSTYINVTLSCSDSGVGCDVTQYCLDTVNNCTPNLTYSTPVRISTEGISYIRYRSNDTLGNLETTKSQTIKIDTTPPTISNEAINDTEIYVNESIKLNCSITDNIAVDIVKFYIEPFGNLTATNADPEFYIICNKTNPCNTTLEGQYNWTSVWVNDTTNNQNSTTVTLNWAVVTTTSITTTTSTSTSTTTTSITTSTIITTTTTTTTPTSTSTSTSITTIPGTTTTTPTSTTTTTLPLTTTTTTVTTTTTIIWPCDLPGDYPTCGEVTLEEVVDFINLWAQGQADLGDVVNLINAWAEGPVCELPGDYPPCGEITLEEVVDFINLWAQGQAELEDVVNLINAWAGS